MSAEVIYLHADEPALRLCVPCLLIWLAAPAFWVGLLAWVVL